MKTLRDIGRRMLFPPLIAAAFLVLFAAGLLIFVFWTGREETAVAYASYLLSFYAMVVACAAIPRLIRLSQRARRNAHVDRFMRDYAFRTHTTLGMSLLLNLAFAGFKLLMGLLYRSYWLIALGVYYAVLALMCFFLLRRLGRAGACVADLTAQYRTYRLTGALMLALGVAMSAIIFQVVRDNQTYSYPGTIIYAFAAYAFYKIILAALNLIRRRGQEEPLLAAVRCLSLATAMVSVFSLQTALLSAFGAHKPQFRLMINAASGAAVCLGMLLIAVTMLCRSSRMLRSR